MQNYFIKENKENLNLKSANFKSYIKLKSEKKAGTDVDNFQTQL